MEISITDIKNKLQESSFDLGTLCQSPNVNRWSWYKPLPLNKDDEVTDAEFKANNFGYINLSFNNPHTLWQYQDSDSVWGYIPPVDHFRMGDFRKYNHFEPIPFQLSINSANYGAVGDSINFSMYRNVNDILDWAILNNNRKLHLGLLLKKGNSIYYNDCGILEDVDAEKIHLVITADLPMGTYECIPTLTDKASSVIVSINKDDNTNTWFALPSTPVSIVVREEPQFNPVKYIELDEASSYGSFNYGTDTYGDFVTNINYEFKIRIKPEYTGAPMDVYLEFKYLNAINDNKTQNITIGNTVNQQLAAGDSDTNNFYYGNKVYRGGYKEPSELIIECYPTARVANKNYTGKSFTITLNGTEIMMRSAGKFKAKIKENI